MSRFGLRSCSDGLKLLEEKNNRRKASNPTSISSKRNVQQKESNFSIQSNNNDEHLIDDIKIELEEIEKDTETLDKLVKNKNLDDEEDDENDDNGNDNENNDNDDEDDCRQQSPLCKGTLVCSLPLDRINEIIQKLNLNKSKVESVKETEDIIEETMDNDDDEEDDNNISKQSASNTKNLCLYCDRKFSSHKLQLKHVDKFHCLQQDRRCSGRNAQLQQQQTQVIPRKRKSTLGSQNFPGCNFCQKTKGQLQPVILPAAELSSLFLHLTDCHTDKYFGCKTCIIRFQNISKLSKHMEIVHKSLPYVFDENSSKSKDNETDSLVSVEKLSVADRSKLSLKRQQRSQKSVNSCLSTGGGNISGVSSTTLCSTAIAPNTSVIGAEEPILSRLGLTQNRLPNNRKGVRLRREKLIPEMLLKSEQNHTSSTNFAFGQTTSISASSTSSSTCSPKLRGKSTKSISGFSGDTNSDVVFRVPTRNDILSCVFDDNFYKEVVSNVRNNLLFHLDGKIMGNSMQELDTSLIRHSHQPQIRSTLVKSPIVVTTMDSEIHAATSLAAVTAFPTLLTAEQFGGDASSSKIRRPHTKNSWKWKWDSVKKFKLINEGGKIVKKMKHPMLGLRDLSKLDMWTQLTMRQKHELQQQQKVNLPEGDSHWHRPTALTDISSDPSREEKQRLNDQLNFILDMRLLPHIILEQNEQAIIKLENDEFGIAPTQTTSEDCGENFMAQTFADESFLSMLNLLPNYETKSTRTKLVLSGEWARPRCYLCICCGAKFEKLKSLEEHKMFRHSQILSTHYEVVGRELLNGNLLRHLFIPKKALSRYGNDIENSLAYSGAARRLFWHKNETLIREITNNEESSDSLQSVLHSCATNSPSLKNSSSSTEDCDVDSKLSTSAGLQLLGTTTVVSPTHSIQSCSSTSSSGGKRQSKIQTNLRSLPISNSNINSGNSTSNIGSSCSKCGRKCNGVLDLYRHMLDCSGDYIWSLAKKRKYRYYCGSKKRRPCNKHSILELRKNKNKTAVKTLSISNDNTTEEGAVSSSNFTKNKSSPRSRPSDAESIKKMLENLPPKRICKKIFPTLSKVKKSIKNIKPKLLAKHKIYNNLRKTRVRQMAQAAKILSKTKSQLKKPKKMVTRSTSALTTKVGKRNNKSKKSIKLAMATKNKITGKTLSKEENIKNSKDEKVIDEVDCCNIKTEVDVTKDPIIIESRDDINKPEEIKETEKELTVSRDFPAPSKPKENTEMRPGVEKSDKSLVLIDKTSKQTSETITNFSANIESGPKETNAKTNPVIISVANPVQTYPIVSSDCERNTQLNTRNVKRSKRISDCIAMLTGKLEEKLKTEQKISAPPAVEKVASSIISHPLKSFIPPASSQPMQQPPLLLPKPSQESENENASPKKTPKRKAFSRRIIKNDVPELSNVAVANASFENKTPELPKIVNPVEFPSTAREFLSTKISTTQEISFTPHTLTTSISPLKTIPEIALSQAENKKQLANVIPTTVVSAMPPPPTQVAPPTVSTLLPKMPLFIPLENVRPSITNPHIPPMALPMPMPVPVAVPIPVDNLAKVSSCPISTAVTAAVTSTGGNILPTPIIPIMTTVPPLLAVPPPNPALQLTISPFNVANNVAEPLNLSNSSKNIQKQSQDLTCASNQRMSGIPARRQTICGFEARNFVMFDEMEPLDLSKKPRPEKMVSTGPFPPRPMEMTSLLLPPQQAIGLQSDTSVLTIPPLTPEALLNKPFYSNLDLLRIPQVRNPVAGQVTVTSTNETIQQPVMVNTIPVMGQPVKATNKKRSKFSSSHTTGNTNAPLVVTSSEGIVLNSGINVTKSNNVKDLINTSSNNKKESSTKNKNTLRMDEEVINHIDDAINSVINAVKASLDSEEAEKAQEMALLKSQTPQPLMQLKTTDDVNATKESLGEFKYLNVARRNMRSKTLDCRPAALNKATIKNTPVSNNQMQDVPALGTVPVVTHTINAITNVIPSVTTNNEILKCLDNKSQISSDCSDKVAMCEKKKDKIENMTETTKKVETPVTISEKETKVLESSCNENLILQNTTTAENVIVENPITTVPVEIVSNNNATQTNKTSKEIHDAPEIPVTITGQIEDKTDKNIATTNSVNIDMEQMSTNNNTSSGFHSSAQSDQQISVMSTSTSAVSVPAVSAGGDAKKKQRRRRKNELAAIVADQLLESFKLDKARRDNLKKLENLAYEKSEDLLLTGMLLMSSTKRNVASSSSNAVAPVENVESAVNSKRTGKTQRNTQYSEAQKPNVDNSATESKTLNESSTIDKSLENEKESLEVAESTDGKKTPKRRQYRRRGKTLDNENISKLKSSLESFSIDIERQLTEYEAKNVNVFKNVSNNDCPKSPSNSKNQTQSSNINKPSIILRPSILSATLESGHNQEITQKLIKPTATTSDSNKTVVSSRDPRLNKNIHKEGEKNNENESVGPVKDLIVLNQKNNTGPEDIGDLEEDNYLTEIAKNVNEKIMSTENEEFAFKDDGFEMANDLGMDDSNSKFSRPPTSMSVRSAPNFNDDRSNFGSICDENTNTEVMDMDLDDEMSVYTSYSQDLGRGRGRRRRRRRSILLTRKPKKRASSRDMSAEKIECILCKKVFYSANSLSKHNMTLAHVSKVSEQEYLLSKSHSNIANVSNSNDLQMFGSLGPYARRSIRRATISEPPMQSRCESNPSPPLTTAQTPITPSLINAQPSQITTTFKPTTVCATETNNEIQDDLKLIDQIDVTKTNKSQQKATTSAGITKEHTPDNNEYDPNLSVNAAYNGNSRLNLNPDERLFFECCNILKSAETPRLNNAVSTGEECVNANYSYPYNHQDKPTGQNTNYNDNRSVASNLNIEPSNTLRSSNNHSNNHQLAATQLMNNIVHPINQQPVMDHQQQTLFRDPQLVNQSTCYNKAAVHDNRNARSPTYSAISHLSAVTNTTSRFKTKAAMKGYENVNIDLNQQQESKSRTICKLTELAEIALGNEDKPNSHDFSPIQSSLTPPQISSHIIHSHQTPKENVDNIMRPKGLVTPEYGTTLVTENIRGCNVQLPTRNERSKNNETRSSTSSKTIMHSSIIKAAVEEHQKVPTSNKIIIPDRPFKNIGLEEKETITFQKPKAPAVNLLTEDNNSVSTGSFSDRDDYDFGSLSCDDEVSVRESNDKNPKNNSTESSSESSRATAKTFENKSLIMGRIFKNASTKAAIKTTGINTVKVKSVGVQKDQTPAPKADLNQLFDELRGNSGVDGIANERVCNQIAVEISPVAGLPSGGNNKTIQKSQYQQQRESTKSIIPAASPPAVVSSTTATPSANARKTKTKTSRAKANVTTKTRKDISKLQTELGMSPDEIKKLIDEGQRKSKRRCATNRPKKLVEMWSSDEYEEFLSTKDIIALIEEKEQQEKRKKRKNSINIPSSTSEVVKEKEVIPDVTSSTKDVKRRNTRRMSMAVERPENLLDNELLPPKNSKSKKANNKKEEPVSTTANPTNASEISQKPEKKLIEKGKGKKAKSTEIMESSTTQQTTSDNNVSRKKNSNKTSANKTKSKPAQKAKPSTSAKANSRGKYKKRQYEDDEDSNEEGNVNNVIEDPEDDDDDDDFLISELKNKQNKIRGSKGKNSKIMATVTAAITTSTPNTKTSKASVVSQVTTSNKKRGASNNNNNTNCNNSNVGTSSNNSKNQPPQNQTPTKSKRKNQSNQSPPRRKRLATEKLYYWSSSSDEDFGRINNKSKPPTDNLESVGGNGAVAAGSVGSGGEQYQKHGWIVGDSHKKLVTLLAIAKGNKKVDSNSGVKKNIGKKRN